MFPEDLITRALAAQKLRHVSDGPKGGIWLVEEGNVEVVVAMVEELEACKEERKGAGGVRMTGVEEDKVEGRWEVLGLGKGGDEGRVFLMHACGFGPKVVEEVKKVVEEVKKVEGSGKAAGGGGEKGKGKAVERPKKSWVGRFLGKI